MPKRQGLPLAQRWSWVALCAAGRGRHAAHALRGQSHPSLARQLDGAGPCGSWPATVCTYDIDGLGNSCVRIWSRLWDVHVAASWWVVGRGSHEGIYVTVTKVQSFIQQMAGESNLADFLLAAERPAARLADRQLAYPPSLGKARSQARIFCFTRSKPAGEHRSNHATIGPCCDPCGPCRFR